MGQNFSWIKQVGHRLDRQRVRRQRAGNLWDEDGSICVENGCICFSKPIKCWSKTTKTYFCLLIYKNSTYFWKNMDWCRASVKTTEFSFSSWWSTSRTLSIGLMKCGTAKCKEAQETRKYFNIVLIRQDNKFFISEHFDVILGAIPLIPHFRTVC